VTSEENRSPKVDEAELERIWNSLRPVEGLENDPDVRLDVQGYLIMRGHYGDDRRALGWGVVDGEAAGNLVGTPPSMG